MKKLAPDIVRTAKYIITVFLITGILISSFYVYMYYSQRECLYNKYLNINGETLYVYELCYAPK